jgi:hypothetical protein
MNDLHNEYLEGEIIYAAKVDSVGVRSGKYRAILDLTINSQRIETIRIYWNDYADSTDIAINSRVGKFSVPLNNLDERDYVFYLVSFDKFGNKSLPFEVSGTVYGDRMQNGLTNRAVTIVVADDGSATITWGSVPENSLYTDVAYTDVYGNSHLVRISNDETSMPSTDLLSIDSVRTVFLPGANVLDTLYPAWKTNPAITESLPFRGPHIFSASVPCEIDVKDFDFGGEGLAFHDSNTSNDPGGSYRTDNGDPDGAAADVESGGNIGYTSAGEWLVFTVEVQDAGVYEADVYLSVNDGNGGAFSISADGVKSEKTVVPNNGDWSAWRWAFETYPELKSTQPKFNLSAGKHKIRFSYESGGFNLMALKFTNTNGKTPSITPFASWSFEDPSDLAKADVNDGVQGIPLGLFGNITAVEGPSPTNKAARIDAGGDNYLKVFHGMLPAGATYVSNWTMMIVFRMPEMDGWHTILQTDITPAGDADFFVRTEGTIGVGALSYLGPALEAGQWYRLIISRKNDFIKSYVNGVQYHNYANASNARFNLLEAFLVSQDEDGEDKTIDIAEIAVWKQPLSTTQIALIETEQQGK